MIPAKTIEELIEKHSILEKELSSGSIDKKLFAEKSKEYSDINTIIDIAKKYTTFGNDKKELETSYFECLFKRELAWFNLRWS